MTDKEITGNAGNMFFYQRLMMRKKTYSVRIKQVFQFQAIYPGCVGLFYIKVVVVVIEVIYNSDSEWIGICKTAEINPCYIQVFTECKVTFRFKYCVHFNESFPNELPVLHIVRNGFPQTVIAIFIFQWNRI